MPGWEETVLAYLLVRPKDASVDKIPPIELELKFVDVTGPIAIPATSAETVIKVATGNTPARLPQRVDLIQTLDTRQFAINGALALEIKASATGLVPDLDQLVSLDALQKAVGIKFTNTHESLQVKEINTWGDAVAPRTERLWTLSLNGDVIRAADGPTEFKFPPARSTNLATVFQTYKDMDLTTLSEPSLKLGRTTEIAGLPIQPARNLPLWIGLGAGVVLLGGGALVALAKRRGAGTERPVRARDVFKMPGEVDGFAVVALLRRLGTSPLVSLREPQQAELQQDLQRVQKACFGSNGSTMSEADLRGVAEKWLRVAC